MLMTTTMAMTTRRRQPNILIAGLGNLLLQDDGVGVHAVHELKKAPPPGALVTEIGTWVLQGLHLYEWADKVLVLDAMQAGGRPGTLYACRDDDVADPGIEASLHELGLLAALKFIKPEKRPEVYVLGVEPKAIDYGLELTPPVQAVLPRFLELARETVERWRIGI
jgi:hydrogenase maturation protease